MIENSELPVPMTMLSLRNRAKWRPDAAGCVDDATAHTCVAVRPRTSTVHRSLSAAPSLPNPPWK